jgi:hypothetical protein
MAKKKKAEPSPTRSDVKVAVKVEPEPERGYLGRKIDPAPDSTYTFPGPKQ